MDKQIIEEFKAIASETESIQAAAWKVHKAIQDYCDRFDIPRSEAQILSPDESKLYGGDRRWYVSFEAGDFQWARSAWWVLRNEHWYTEPVEGFDLSFEVA